MNLVWIVHGGQAAPPPTPPAVYIAPPSPPTIIFVIAHTCSASQDHKTAFGQYAMWRDAINATGREVYFSLCGWETWYAPPDPSLNYTGAFRNRRCRPPRGNLF